MPMNDPLSSQPSKILNTILFIGPMPPPVHGQAVGFKAAYEGYSGNKILVDQNMTQRGFFYRVVMSSWNLLRVLYLMMSRKIDIVYFTCNRSPLGGLFDITVIGFSSFFNKKIVNHLFGGDFKAFHDAMNRGYKKLLDKAYKRVALSIVEHQCLAPQFEDLFPEMRVRVISNFYNRDLESITSVEKQDPVHLLYLSNLMKSKGILELLDAFGNLSEKYLDVTLTIAGAYLADEFMTAVKIREEVLTRLDYLKEVRKKKVEYVGVVSGLKKKIVLQNSDIFLLPTYYASEGFPLSIVEAMRAGNVIIVTDHNYLSKIFTNKNGRIIAKKSVKDIEDAITFFTDHSDSRREVQEYNLQYAKEFYSMERYLDSLNDAFNAV